MVNVRSGSVTTISVGISWQMYRYVFCVLLSPNSPPYISSIFIRF